MKYCIHCGNEVLDDAVICPKCGCSVQYDDKSAQQGGAAAPAPVADSYSPLSIAGFILSFFLSLVGLILSIVAYNEAKRTGSRKSLSFSKAGIIISAISLGLGVFIVFISIVFVFIGISMIPYVVI